MLSLVWFSRSFGSICIKDNLLRLHYVSLFRFHISIVRYHSLIQLGSNTKEMEIGFTYTRVLHTFSFYFCNWISEKNHTLKDTKHVFSHTITRSCKYIALIKLLVWCHRKTVFLKVLYSEFCWNLHKSVLS